MNDGLVIINIFSNLEDPRKKIGNIWYPLEEILLVAFATLLSGGENYEDMAHFGNAKLDFFRTLRPFKNGIPTESTFERIFSLINPKQFEQCLTEWADHLHINYNDEVISIDGKTARRSGSKVLQPIHMVSAWASKNRVVLGCTSVDEKSNEITAIPRVLQMLSLAGTIVTMDAMGCQHKIADQIVDQGGDYVLSLKGNQSSLHEDVKTFFALDKDNTAIEWFETLEKDHGRIEKRRYGLYTKVDWLTERHPLWHTIGGIGCVVSKRTVNDLVTSETRYFIMSKSLGVDRFANAVRSHWGVENALHHFLDVALHEDYSRVRNRHAAANLSIMRRMAVNKISRNKDPKRSKRVMRLVAGWDNHYLKTLLIPA